MAPVPFAGCFDGFHAVPAAVSSTGFVRFDNNCHSVVGSALGHPVAAPVSTGATILSS